MFRGSPGLSADQLADIGSVHRRGFQRRHAREHHSVSLHCARGGPGPRAAHRGHCACARCSIRRRDWDQERGAIEQEVAQDLSEPGLRALREAARAHVHGHALRARRAGHPAVFREDHGEMLKSFHDAWYAPNNAILVIAGDVDPQRGARRSAQLLFDEIPWKRLPERPGAAAAGRAASFTVDTDQPGGTLMIATRTRARQPRLRRPSRCWRTCSATSVSISMAGAAGQGLERRVRARAAAESGLAYASWPSPPGSDPQALEREVRAILGRVARDGVPAGAGRRRRSSRSAATHELQRNSISELAAVWSDALALYGLDSPDDDLARIEKVTVADVNRVARQYLDLDHAVTAVMLPRGSGRPMAAEQRFRRPGSDRARRSSPDRLPPWAQRRLTRLSVPPSTLHPIVTRLPNGMT